jgi:hypothetical protein
MSATALTPQHRLQDAIYAERSAEIVAALVSKLGGEVRLRFLDIPHRPQLTVWHDASTDELVLLVKEPTAMNRAIEAGLSLAELKEREAHQARRWAEMTEAERAATPSVHSRLVEVREAIAIITAVEPKP